MDQIHPSIREAMEDAEAFAWLTPAEKKAVARARQNGGLFIA